MSSKIALLLSFSFVAGCSTSTFPLAERAAQEGLERSVVRTATFEHSIYRKGGDEAYQVVFIEGDGRPWNRAGLALPVTGSLRQIPGRHSMKPGVVQTG